MRVAVLWIVSWALTAGAAGPVAVPPFVVVSGDVPVRVAQKAHGVFLTELNSGGVEVAPEPASAQRGEDGLELARQHLDGGTALRARRKLAAADAEATRAVDRLTAAAAALDGPGLLVEALTLRAVVSFSLGRDERGTALVERALALDLGRQLPYTEGSPGFTRVVNEARARVTAAPRGSVRMESVPTNIPVEVDGVPVGVTPVVVTGLVKGDHLWRATFPTGERTGGLVTVDGSRRAEVTTRLDGGGPLAQLLGAVARNTVDVAALNAARAVASARSAESVVVVGLASEGDQLAMETLVVRAASGELRRLRRVRFDRELLSAGVEFLALATSIAQGEGEVVKAPAPVMPGLAAASSAVEVDFTARAGPSADPDEPKVDVAAPAAQKKRRSPLVRP